MTPPTSGTTGRALVVGAGISGMAAAIRLRQAGWQPVIVERSPQRRTGGYFIGLYPGGRNAAKSMGLYEHIHTRTRPRRVRGKSTRTATARAASALLSTGTVRTPYCAVTSRKPCGVAWTASRSGSA
ncbi:FAD-dependent oxidoreductase [Streptomyces sp. NPDC002643]